MNTNYKLVVVNSEEEWKALHDLRRSELFSRHKGIVYNANHPDDHKQNHFHLVLIHNDKCIGTARLDVHTNNIGIIRLVVIDSKSQRQGHGRVLGQKIEEFARIKGINKLLVNAHKTAKGYYEKLGFIYEDWTDIKGTHTGLAKDCIPMTKVI